VNRHHSFGAYVMAQYQLGQNWYAGLRYDYTEFPNLETRGPDDEDWAASSYVSWYLTESLRLRLEYQHLGTEINSRHKDEDLLMLGLTFYIGAHPPHPYWVNR
jgi:hypothetical protein